MANAAAKSGIPNMTHSERCGLVPVSKVVPIGRVDFFGDVETIEKDFLLIPSVKRHWNKCECESGAPDQLSRDLRPNTKSLTTCRGRMRTVSPPL